MSAIRIFPTEKDLDVDAILEVAKSADLENVFIIGELKNGGRYITGNIANLDYVNVILDLAKRDLLETIDQMDQEG